MQAETALKDKLCALEKSVLEPAVRSSPDELDQLLADEFVEFGSSGRVFNKQQVVAALQTESGAHWSLTDFRARLLGPGVALVTYRSVQQAEQNASRHSLRSSIWILQAGRWQMSFHQGTPTEP